MSLLISFNVNQKNNAQELFYKECAKSPYYLGLFFNRFLNEYLILVEPLIYTWSLILIKIHGTI